MKIVVMIILTLSGMLMACSEGDSNHAGHESKHSGAHINDKVSLDNGAKWRMDTHTRKMFLTMSERLNAVGDRKQIGENLNEDLHKLIKGCTMTGAAHHQLHLFLTPFIPAVKELSKSGTEDALKEVQHTLDDYQHYFE